MTASGNDVHKEIAGRLRRARRRSRRPGTRLGVDRRRAPERGVKSHHHQVVHRRRRSGREQVNRACRRRHPGRPRRSNPASFNSSVSSGTPEEGEDLALFEALGNRSRRTPRANRVDLTRPCPTTGRSDRRTSTACSELYKARGPTPSAKRLDTSGRCVPLPNEGCNSGDFLSTAPTRRIFSGATVDGDGRPRDPSTRAATTTSVDWASSPWLSCCHCSRRRPYHEVYSARRYTPRSPSQVRLGRSLRLVPALEPHPLPRAASATSGLTLKGMRELKNTWISRSSFNLIHENLTGKGHAFQASRFSAEHRRRRTRTAPSRSARYILLNPSTHLPPPVRRGRTSGPGGGFQGEPSASTIRGPSTRPRRASLGLFADKPTHRSFSRQAIPRVGPANHAAPDGLRPVVKRRCSRRDVIESRA